MSDTKTNKEVFGVLYQNKIPDIIDDQTINKYQRVKRLPSITPLFKDHDFVGYTYTDIGDVRVLLLQNPLLVDEKQKAEITLFNRKFLDEDSLTVKVPLPIITFPSIQAGNFLFTNGTEYLIGTINTRHQFHGIVMYRKEDYYMILICEWGIARRVRCFFEDGNLYLSKSVSYDIFGIFSSFNQSTVTWNDYHRMPDFKSEMATKTLIIPTDKYQFGKYIAHGEEGVVFDVQDLTNEIKVPIVAKVILLAANDERGPRVTYYRKDTVLKAFWEYFEVSPYVKGLIKYLDILYIQGNLTVNINNVNVLNGEKRNAIIIIMPKGESTLFQLMKTKPMIYLSYKDSIIKQVVTILTDVDKTGYQLLDTHTSNFLISFKGKDIIVTSIDPLLRHDKRGLEYAIRIFEQDLNQTEEELNIKGLLSVLDTPMTIKHS
ncbi:MAG: hypothetical protein Solumvirus5_11 [Solumvirus sp.]|uniref:Uncharacterized protein n=1 Tax=Solumvirus sp. TaxID=2487773 RepID=A0A3G5AIC9_9VIRU|nr:MAG: hypothetical protein Solumvirus5_11 [Solumvirus sp.]